MINRKSTTSLFYLLCISVLAFGQSKPVTPNASPEAVALLNFIYSQSGVHALAGQHNFPIAGDRSSQFASRFIGKTPIVWSTDFGFSKDGDKDSYLARPMIVEEAKRQHQLGSLITICWHAVPPTADEPITFQPLPGADPAKLASVQGKLTDKQFQDILTKGTALNKRWMAQVDSIAKYLKILKDAHVPILWRPYHEMNGDWFWWGNRVGKFSTAALYRQIFDRLVNYHKLNNLIWVWSIDRPSRPGMEFTNFYPGDKYLDILALDVYGRDFNQSYYDGLLALSKGKPVTLAEVGNPPTPEILEKQPKWSYWVVWSDMVRLTSRKEYEALAGMPRMLFMEDTAYQQGLAEYRTACGLPPVAVKKKIDFSGEWVLNEEKSVLGNFGPGNLPSRITVVQHEEAVDIHRQFIGEWDKDRVTDEVLRLDGTESKSEWYGAPRLMTAKLSAKGDTLKIASKITFNRNGQTSVFTTDESWTIQTHDEELVIVQTSKTFRGEQKVKMIFSRR